MENTKGRLGVLLRCCMCIGGAMGMVSNCIGIYFTPLAKALDVGVGRISIMVTLISLGNALFAPMFVRLRKRYPLNRIMAAGIILCILSYLLMSVAGNVWVLYLCGILSGIGMCNFSALPVTLILRDWYGEKNGTAVGAALAFSGVFGAIMNPILSRLISTLSYQTSLRIMALFLAAAVLPCALTLRLRAQAPASSSAPIQDAKPQSPEVPLPIIIVLFSTCVCFCTLCGMNQHFSALAVAEGYSLEASATVLTCSMIGNIIFKLCFGYASDRINPILVAVVWAVIGTVGTATILLFAGNGLLIRAGAGMYGAFFSLSTVALSMLTQKVAGDRYAEVYAKLVIFTATSYALSVSLYGLLYDLTGSYRPALIFIIAMAILSIFLSLILKKKTDPAHE